LLKLANGVIAKKYGFVDFGNDPAFVELKIPPNDNSNISHFIKSLKPKNNF
jgi:hypothetical protein